MTEQGQGGLRFSIGPNTGPSAYCNSAKVVISFFDFNFEFSQNVPVYRGQAGDLPAISANPIQRIVMSPEHAKAFLKLLRDSVANYEEQYGEIKPAPRPTPPPQANETESS
jgi:uncharacterized protein DUF3467